jgi:hypothetical protein
VRGRLVRFRGDQQIRAAGGEIVGVADLGVQRVGDDDGTAQ